MVMESDTRARARDRVLLELKTQGPQGSAQLAEKLEVTPMAVRQHLAVLEDEQLVSHSDRRGGVGRPARIWKLTPLAASRFPDSHAELTVDLIETIRDSLGEEALDRLISTRTRRQLASYRERLPGGGATLEARLAALTAIRRGEGYMAEYESDLEDGWLFIENHCPICAAAQICQSLCRDELELFRNALGDDVSVERDEHALKGARRCTYHIRPRASQ
jgi:predicted ArsR family transcriptional regulator